MKKGKFLLLAVLSVFLFGCGPSTKNSSSSIKTSFPSISNSDSSSTSNSFSSSSSTAPIPDNVAVESVQIEQNKSIEMILGSTLTLTAKVLPENATNKKVTWKSSNINVATINSGNVVAKAIGTVTITVTSKENSSITDAITINVVAAEITGVTLDVNQVNLKSSKTQQIKATVLPANPNNLAVTFKSKDPSIASVSSNGTITAYMHGSTVVSAEINGFEASCVVNVSKILPALPMIASIIPEDRPKQFNDYFYTTPESGYKDTMTMLGDGVESHEYKIPGIDGKLRTAYSIIVDLSKASIESGSPNNAYSATKALRATVYNQINAFNSASKTKKVIAGVNADFFGGTNLSNNIWVKDGVVVNSKAAFKDDSATSKLYSGQMVFGISYNNVPIITEGTSAANFDYHIDNMIDVYNDTGTTISRSYVVDAINDNLVLNAHLGNARPRNNEVITVSGQNVTNKNVIVLNKIDKHDNGVGNINFPVDGAVVEVKNNFSGAVELADNQFAILGSSGLTNAIKQNTLIRVGRTESDNPKLNNMKVVLGGRHELIRDYEIVDTLEKETTNGAKSERGRTAVGILGDGRVFVFVIVDDSSQTARFNLLWMADFMEYQGCRYAMNFDGGGSTRYLINTGYNGSGTIDVLAGGKENRAVANTLLVTTK